MEKPERIGDGICDDMPSEIYNVTSKCAGDMGDCCMPVIDTSRCVECICLNDNLTHASSMMEFIQNSQNVSELALELSENTRNLATTSNLVGQPAGALVYSERSCKNTHISKFQYHSTKCMNVFQNYIQLIIALIG